ncbi:MAG: GspH/FimT family pseudopilin [Gammaproteobacteria bacterium]|nr:GspH/FimT family pseudopilin [Gammaproteobacteria bacterium]MBU1725462.1 GspH/FimT family pseudopilin [Gammaproteobacteria bacterium]MBU2005801.1 GspH/FimT family pseudopilin [Gammaproteobacteria bacterium]
MNNKQQGMTLVELMVTLAVVAILASVAAPSLSSMMENNRLTAINNQLFSAIFYTRSEAIKRSFPVTMCAKAADNTCATAADAAAGAGFEDGWIIFVDCNPDEVIDTTNVCDFDGNGTAEAPETILSEDVPSGMSSLTVRPDTAGSTLGRAIRYLPNGNTSFSGTLNLRRNDENVYLVKIKPITGRASSCKVGNTGC